MRLRDMTARRRKKLHIHLKTDNFRIRHRIDPIAKANFF